MSNEQWHRRWQQGRIGFHLSEVNPLLTRHIGALPSVEDWPRILVPLCGKSVDLIWLRERGFDVLGIELSQLAVEAFFEEQNLMPTIENQGPFSSYRVPGLQVLCGDFFGLEGELVGELACCFDRAALIALSEGSRERYAQHLARVLPSGSPMLLISLEYPQKEMKGPPFSVPETQVRELFEPHFRVDRLQRENLHDVDVLDAPGSPFPHLSRLHEVAYRLSRR